MFKEFQRRTAIILMFSVLLFVQACGGSAATSEPGTAEPIKLIVTIRQSTSFAPLYIAQAEGFFTEQGLEVEFIAAPPSADAVAALLSGNIDVFPSSVGIGMFNGMAQGGTMKIVANKGYFDPDGCTYFGVIARKDLYDSGEITSVEDLVGHPINLLKTLFQGYITDAGLKPYGLSHADLELDEIRGPAVITALEEKAIDAAFLGEPSITAYVDMGLGEVILRGEQVLPGFTYGFIAFGPNLLEDNPEAGEKFIRAYQQGVSQYNEGKTDRNLEIMVEAIELDKEILAQSCWPPITTDFRMDVQSIQAFQAWANDLDLLDDIATEEQWWEPRFLDSILDNQP